MNAPIPFPHMTRRRLLVSALVAAGCIGLPLDAAWSQERPRGGAANLAMIGELQSLDPMITPTDLVGTVMQHEYEPLYTFDAQWNIQPMLAESMPVISADGKTYAITLRPGVKFHDGQDMHADDVVASLQRWMEVSTRGKAVAQEVAGVRATGPLAVEIQLKSVYAPLLAHLAMPSGMAGIMPRTAIANPLTDIIGTGPYRLKERKPDQYMVLARFDQYAARSEPASGYAGRREALLDELRFVPVPNATTRVEGVLAGQFHYADLLQVEAMSRLEKAAPDVVPILTEGFGFPYIVFNTQAGVLAKKAMRQAVHTSMGEAEMLLAGFGDPRFFMAEPNFFPKGTPYYSDAGADRYNQKNPKLAKEQAEKAGYKGEPVRIMVSRQYEFHYNMALVMAEHLKRAGFKTELMVVDWATLVQRRNDPQLWDVYVTHSGQFPEPMLSPPQLGSGAPGWWETDTKKAALAAFNGEPDMAKRGPLWGQVQDLIYDEVPFVEVGRFNALSARSAKLQGYTPAAWPFFWNTSLAQ